MEDKGTSGPILDFKGGILYRVLIPSDADGVMDLVASSFIKEEPLSSSLVWTSSEMAVLSKIYPPLFLSNGLSIGAFDAETKQLIGYRASVAQKDRDPKLLPFDSDDTPNMRKLDRIYKEVGKDFNLFEIKGVDELVYFFGLCVHSDYGKRGIGRTLVDKAVEVSKEHGYKLICADTSSNYCRKIFEDVGFDTLNTIVFADYKVDGKVVFTAVPEPHKKITFHTLRI